MGIEILYIADSNLVKCVNCYAIFDSKKGYWTSHEFGGYWCSERCFDMIFKQAVELKICDKLFKYD